MIPARDELPRLAHRHAEFSAAKTVVWVYCRRVITNERLISVELIATDPIIIILIIMIMK